MADSEYWHSVWTGLALSLLQGCCSTSAIEKWAKANKYPLPVVARVARALAVEDFDHKGKVYWRLSGLVVPFIPRAVRDVRTYRQAGGSAA